MAKTSFKKCKSCKYSKIISTNEVYCDYYCMTGKHRGCNVGECDKYEKREVKK